MTRAARAVPLASTMCGTRSSFTSQRGANQGASPHSNKSRLPVSQLDETMSACAARVEVNMCEETVDLPL